MGHAHQRRGPKTNMSFSLTTQFSQQYTYIPNAFIDTYMPEANGSFVKVYLYLLRQMGTVTPVLTIEMMADMLSNTEADILRALRYWKKQGLLEIEEKDGEITHLCLLPLEFRNHFSVRFLCHTFPAPHYRSFPHRQNRLRPKIRRLNPQELCLLPNRLHPSLHRPALHPLQQ